MQTTELLLEAGDTVSVDGAEITILFMARRGTRARFKHHGPPPVVTKALAGLDFPRESAREERERHLGAKQ